MFCKGTKVAADLTVSERFTRLVHLGNTKGLRTYMEWKGHPDASDLPSNSMTA